MELAAEHTPIHLPLSPTEQWTLHHVLSERIERARRYPANTDPPPEAVVRAFEKVEAGDSWLTQGELEYVREELRAYRRSPAGPPPDRQSVTRLLRRITAVLAGRRPTTRRFRSARPARRGRPR